MLRHTIGKMQNTFGNEMSEHIRLVKLILKIFRIKGEITHEKTICNKRTN